MLEGRSEAAFRILRPVRAQPDLAGSQDNVIAPVGLIGRTDKWIGPQTRGVPLQQGGVGAVPAGAQGKRNRILRVNFDALRGAERVALARMMEVGEVGPSAVGKRFDGGGGRIGARAVVTARV